VKWTAHNARPFGGPKRQSYRSGDFALVAHWGKGRYRRQTKQVVWHLYEKGRMIGRPFASSLTAKAFAEAYAAIPADDKRARAEFVRDGGHWSYQWERARREKMADARRERWRAEQEAREASA
jgi:hypothetical protein